MPSHWPLIPPITASSESISGNALYDRHGWPTRFLRR